MRLIGFLDTIDLPRNPFEFSEGKIDTRKLTKIDDYGIVHCWLQ